MTRLANFSVENENTVLLNFLDGTHKRVHPSEVSRHLKGDDLDKVKRALKLRKHFIDKILPPGAAVLLLGCVIALGAYDAHRISTLMHNQPAPGASAVASPNTNQPAAAAKTNTQEEKEASAPDVSAMGIGASSPAQIQASPGNSHSTSSTKETTTKKLINIVTQELRLESKK